VSYRQCHMPNNALIITTSSSKDSYRWFPCDEYLMSESLNAYSDLRRQVVAAHLLAKQPAYYAGQMILTLCIFVLCLTLIAFATNLLSQVCVAGLLALVSTHAGFIVHDAGHSQIFRSRSKNNLVGMICANFLLGFSYSCWIDTHNRHHKSPNQCGVDPDIDFPLLAFSQEQALQKTGAARFVVKYQAYLFFPLLLLEAINLKVDGLRFLITRRPKSAPAEIVCLAAHYSLWGAFLFHFLGASHAIVFTVIYYAFFGLNLGIIFVTNHKGMPLLSEESNEDFLRRQVITARNLEPSWLVDSCFGGLTCQIEHHLFPAIPRNKLRPAQKVIRAYCEAHDIPYYQTGLLQSYREVLAHLEQVSVALRQ
jgi:fatty acid desaturase